MNNMIRILLVDDQTLLRTTLKEHLETKAGAIVVDACEDGETAANRAAELNPDIVLMDIDMPGMSAFEAASHIRSRCPNSRVAFLSGYVYDHYIDQALAIESFGYISKSEPPDVLFRAICSIAHGIPYFSPEVRERIVVGPGGARLSPNGSSRLSALSRRERETLTYIAKGLSKKQTATCMHLTPATVNRHCTRLMEKLDIHDRVELARFAIREKLVEP